MRPKIINFHQLYANSIPKNNYLSHAIHSYSAKLIPHIPRFFIENYTEENDVVLDPFCGSGTSLLEARISGRNSVGIDINPLATLISKVKTTQYDEKELYSAMIKIKKSLNKNNRRTPITFPNIDYWFSKKAQKELASIKYNIENFKGKFSEDIYRFLLTTFSSIIRKSSFADPRMAKTYKSKRVVEKIQNGWVPTPIEHFKEALEKNFNMMKSLAEHQNLNNNYVKTYTGDARNTSILLKKAGIKKTIFIITSPPYINAQDYFRTYKFELWWLGLVTAEEVNKLKKRLIGTENISGCNRNVKPISEDKMLQTILIKLWKKERVKSYIVHNFFQDMKRTLIEFYNSLKKGGHLCLITGNNTICEISIPTNQVLNRIASNIGFNQVEIIKDKIKNRALPPERNHKGGVIKEEWITVLEKAG